MRRGFGVLGVTVTVILLIIVAAIGYNIGWSQGVGRRTTTATASTRSSPASGSCGSC